MTVFVPLVLTAWKAVMAMGMKTTTCWQCYSTLSFSSSLTRPALPTG